MLSLVPLGDQAVLAYFADEAAALRFAAAARAAGDRWLEDVVQAYTSVAVFYNLDLTGFDHVAARLGQIEAEGRHDGAPPPGRLHHIPCCYALEQDLASRGLTVTRRPYAEVGSTFESPVFGATASYFHLEVPLAEYEARREEIEAAFQESTGGRAADAPGDERARSNRR